MAEYEDGQIAASRANFTDPLGQIVDPTVVRVIVRSPAGVSTTFTYGADIEVVQEAAGQYRINTDTTDGLGTWIVRWECSGSHSGAREHSFYVY